MRVMIGAEYYDIRRVVNPAKLKRLEVVPLGIRTTASDWQGFPVIQAILDLAMIAV